MALHNKRAGMALSKEYHKLLLISPPRTLGRHLKLKQCRIKTLR